MTRTRTTDRHRPRALRTAVTTVCAVGALVLGLTACNGDDGAAAGTPGAGQPAATASASGAGASPSAGKGTDAGGGQDGNGSGGGGKSSGAPAKPAASVSASSGASASSGGKGGGGGVAGEGDDCDHKMPISPDEFAVYGYTPEGGQLGLIVKYGNWGCPTPDSDGPPFEPVGKEIYQQLDQAADITVTDPIVASTDNQPIGVQEFIDWLDAHPDSGLVFKYHLGADGVIDRLDQIFVP
ncbi:hypothetical protein ACIQPQ_26300 [Streptomyces sp. NPDC091281]|uniref:hypothetical protein n=1 Tax=Streptomyces sp. NPDC091281 TaxID=3365985 RepID=UPI0038096259